MSSKTDDGHGGRGYPPTKPEFEGYKRRYHYQRKKSSDMKKLKRVTFNGLTEDLKYHIYEVGTVYQSGHFTATTKALMSYAGRRCTYTKDIRISIGIQKDVVIIIPFTRTNINVDVVNILLGKDIGAYVKCSQQYRQRKEKIYSVDLEQCTKEIKKRLKGE